jgi:hypothetical protein
MSSRRNGAGSALDRARAVLSETQAKLAALGTERDTALLRGTDADVAQVDGRIEQAERLLRTHSDRVRLLEAEAEKDEAARRVKEHAAHIGRVEARLVDRGAIVAELAKHVAAADAAFVKLCTINQTIMSAWPWENGHIGAALLGAGDVARALSHELFRIGGRVPPGGGQPNPHPAPTWPGAKCARLEDIMLPERTTPLVERFAQAGATASVIMRTGRNGPAPAPETNGAAAYPPVTASPAETGQSTSVSTPQAPPLKPSLEMLGLLERQNVLVSGHMNADQDAEYESISKRIRELAEQAEGASA